MGDAGSTPDWFLPLSGSYWKRRRENSPISPIYRARIIAIPLMDMVAIMYRRLHQRDEPLFPVVSTFTILSCAPEFTSRQAFVLITLAAAILAG